MILKHRNTSFRRKTVKVAHKVKVHYEKRKPQKAQCAGCGRVLMGVPRERPYKMRHMGKTVKRPERPYGGVLCSICTRQKMMEKAQAIALQGV